MHEYVIYYKNGKKRIELKHCKFENNDAAIEAVDALRKSITDDNTTLKNEKGEDIVIKNKNKIFWDIDNPIRVVNKDGEVIKEYKTLSEQLDEWKRAAESEPWYEKVYYWFVRKWNHYDPWFNIKLGFERMFTGYDRRVAWNIDLAVFNLLKHAVKKYINNMHGCPQSYLDKAGEVIKTFADNGEALTQHSSETYKMELAMGLYRADLKNLLFDIDLAEYYREHGIVDDDIYIDTHTYPIPTLKNSEHIDYVKCNELHQEVWNRIFKYLNEHLLEMWD